MNYTCPSCKTPRTDEIRETIDGVLYIINKYGKGCYMKLQRVGHVWKLVEEKCANAS